MLAVIPPNWCTTPEEHTPGFEIWHDGSAYLNRIRIYLSGPKKNYTQGQCSSCKTWAVLIPWKRAEQ